MLFVQSKALIKNKCFLIFSYEVKHKLNIKINIHVVKKRFLLRTTLYDCASENREFVNSDWHFVLKSKMTNVLFENLTDYMIMLNDVILFLLCFSYEEQSQHEIDVF
jgi:hypothetical protein